MTQVFRTIRDDKATVEYQLTDEGYTLADGLSDFQLRAIIHGLSNALRDYCLAGKDTPSGMKAEIVRLKRELAEAKGE